MNARAELDKVGFATIARDFLAAPTAVPRAAAGTGGSASFWSRLWGDDLPRLLGQHLALVLVSVLAATLIGVPLAMALAARPAWRTLVLGATGALQTIPALALLALAIGLLGRIGTAPALLVLTVYALLPILHNACTGLAEVPAGLKLAAQALGLTAGQRLRLVELPLALPVIVTGIRTATSLAVGTATIAAFIGAGGLGERIVTGLALNDRALMMAGALPAAALALACEGLFALLARQLKRRREPA